MNMASFGAPDLKACNTQSSQRRWNWPEACRASPGHHANNLVGTGRFLEANGHKYLGSFLDDGTPTVHISKPEASRTSCSRLSPYLAWGALSVRQSTKPWRPRRAGGTTTRLGAGWRWHCHFIQSLKPSTP